MHQASHSGQQTDRQTDPSSLPLHSIASKTPLNPSPITPSLPSPYVDLPKSRVSPPHPLARYNTNPAPPPRHGPHRKKGRLHLPTRRRRASCIPTTVHPSILYPLRYHRTRTEQYIHRYCTCTARYVEEKNGAPRGYCAGAWCGVRQRGRTPRPARLVPWTTVSVCGGERAEEGQFCRRPPAVGRWDR